MRVIRPFSRRCAIVSTSAADEVEVRDGARVEDAQRVGAPSGREVHPPALADRRGGDEEDVLGLDPVVEHRSDLGEDVAHWFPLSLAASVISIMRSSARRASRAICAWRGASSRSRAPLASSTTSPASTRFRSGALPLRSRSSMPTRCGGSLRDIVAQPQPASGVTSGHVGEVHDLDARARAPLARVAHEVALGADREARARLGVGEHALPEVVRRAGAVGERRRPRCGTRGARRRGSRARASSRRARGLKIVCTPQKRAPQDQLGASSVRALGARDDDRRPRGRPAEQDHALRRDARPAPRRCAPGAGRARRGLLRPARAPSARSRPRSSSCTPRRPSRPASAFTRPDVFMYATTISVVAVALHELVEERQRPCTPWPASPSCSRTWGS